MTRKSMPSAPVALSTSEQVAQIKRFLRVIWRARTWVFACWLFVFLGSVVVAYTMPNTFRSSTMILVERQKVPEAYVRSTVSEDMQERLKTITQQILSRSQIRLVIEEYDLQSEPTMNELVLERLHLRDVAWVQSWGQKVGLLPDPHAIRTADRMVSRFKKDVQVKVVGRQAFSVAYEGHDPLTVMRVTNAMAGMFISENLRLRETRAEGTTRFLESQLEESRRELELSEATVQEYKQKKMGALPGQLDANLRALDRLQMELQHIDESMAALAQQKSFAQKQLISAEQQFAEMSEDARSALRRSDPLAQQLATLEVRLSRLRTQYTDRFPEVAQVNAQIAEIKTKLKERETLGEFAELSAEGIPVLNDLREQVSQIDHDAAALRARRDRLEKDFVDYQSRVETTPHVEQELQKLQRDYSIMQSNYQALLQKQMNARLAESLERRQKGEQFRVIDPANLPVVPVSPNRPLLILLGMVVGAGLGVGVALAMDAFRPRFHTDEDVHMVLGLPVLAVIPQVREFEHES